MSSTMSGRAPFVSAAKVAGRLYGVLATAREITLSASNAKSIAARGGDKTAGFRPITDFVNEMARDTISLVSRINQSALAISVTSVNKTRCGDARQRFANAVALQESHAQSARLTEIIAGLDRQIVEYQRHESALISQISALFDEIEQRTRASRIIATNSRVEASRASEFQPYLESIADNVERASASIQQEIAACRRFLSELGAAISAA